MRDNWGNNPSYFAILIRKKNLEAQSNHIEINVICFLHVFKTTYNKQKISVKPV
jgi:hypothetical protein